MRDVINAERFTWLSPAAPAAIAVVRTPAITALADRPLPAIGRARLVRVLAADGTAVDEAVAVRNEDGSLDLMIHGGPGVRAAITAALASHGLVAATGTGSDDRWSRLARAAHPAAVAWLLAHPAGEPPFPAAFLDRLPLVLITGPTNAGKSTLLNAWCGHRRALVSDLPGTTRDLVMATTLVDGWRLRLVDSAGLRTTGDALEQAGQALVERMRGTADVVLHLRPEDAREPPRPGDLAIHAKADCGTAPPPGTLCWSCHGLPGRDAPALLAELGRAVRARLGLPALA